ncbi:MAG: response regulator transcription factor [Oscillospiraceae bacterium]|nr:response regulator transcription factor [Oscillospiraceae bacterium]
MKILVVDDEKLLVKGIKFNLETEGYQVDAAYDGEECVKLARANGYDLIILDLMMPKLNGLDACMKIREFSTVPVIMLTARGDDMDKIIGFEYGADDYITKPFNILELFMKNPGRVYSRENLLNIVWGRDYQGDVRTVDVHVHRLRDKLETDPASPEYIITKWGVGYYFKGQ